MRLRTRWILLGLACVAVAAAAAAADSPAPLEPSAGYLAPGGAPSGSQTLFAPWHVWSTEAETLLQNVTAESQEECAALCWQDPDCMLFDFRTCADQAAVCAGAPSRTCRLFGMGCGSVTPLATPVDSGSGGAVWEAAGFPMRYDLQDGGRFDVQPGRGLVGGDLECDATLVPGICALGDIREVSRVCSTNRTDCDAVVLYYAGLDGCSSPLFLLKSSRLTSSGYLAPTVATLTKLDQSVRLSRMVRALDGNYTLPSPAELEAAAPGADPNATASDRPWLGCFSGAGLLLAGNVVGVVDGIPDPDACCHACRQDPACNVWAFCPDPAGCNYTREQRSFQLAGGQCELRFNNIASEATAFPPMALAKGASVPFVGGAPLAVAAPQPPIDGFTALPGVTQYLDRLQCDGSLRPDIGECVLPGTAQELASTCQSMPNCRAVAAMPEGGVDLPPGQPIGLLKSNVTESNWALNLHTVLLLRQDQANQSGNGSVSGPAEQPSGSSSLSAGAIASIAIGVCAAAAAATAGGWVLVRRRRSRLAQQVGKAGSEGPLGSEAPLGTAPKPTAPLDDSSCSVPLTVSIDTPPATVGQPSGEDTTAATSASEATPVPSTDAANAAVPIRFLLPSSARPSPFTARSQAPAPPWAVSSADVGGSSSFGDASSSQIVPELRDHIAQCDAALSYGRHLAASGGSANAGILLQPSLLSSGELPAALQDWVVDIRDVQLLRAANGDPMELGSGATATVYKAKLRGETVAAKEMDLGRSHEVQQLFVQEAERLHQLRHPHVVALYGVSLSGPKGYLLMEYCAGRDLAACLGLKVSGSSRRLFGWYSRGRKVAMNIAAAVNFLHSRGIVHFDIKASNVLLTATGAAKLADVGVARLKAGTHLSYTPIVGTFAWMAPEVITGARCSEKVDLYSIGVLLWEICTGERPRRGDMREPRVPEECPQEVVDLIEKCMSLDPQDRPSAQQLLARLEELEELSPRGDGGGKQHAGGSGAGVKMGSGAVRPDSWEAAGSSVNSS